MAKTRLAARHREMMEQLARTLVASPETLKPLDTLYKTTGDLVRKMVEKAHPIADMEILKKYNCAAISEYIQFRGTTGGVVSFQFRKDEGVLSVDRYHIYLADERLTNAYNAYAQASDKHTDALKAKLADYYALIKISTTFEEVLEVWPEVEQLRSKLGLQAVAIMSPDVIKRIRSDVKARLKAA